MSFWDTFSKHFDHPPPFEVPHGAHDTEEMVTTDPSLITDELFGFLGASALFKLPARDFLCAAIQSSQGGVTLYLMVIEGERYFYFREQARDVFNAGASPEACFAKLTKMWDVFKGRKEPSFKLSYNQGKLQVNKKTLGEK